MSLRYGKSWKLFSVYHDGNLNTYGGPIWESYASFRFVQSRNDSALDNCWWNCLDYSTLLPTEHSAQHQSVHSNSQPEQHAESSDNSKRSDCTSSERQLSVVDD